MSSEPSSVSAFSALGCHAALVRILSKSGVTSPTPIQTQAIPIALQGGDVVGIAQTGTGKTYAFGLPMLERIAKNKFRGLILVPTRELALQVDEALRAIGGSMGLKTAVLIGGERMGKQLRELSKKPHLLIATPGRLIDHLTQRTVKLHDVGVLVMDEADRMLDMGFLPQITQILEHVPVNRQTMLFSATMPTEIAGLTMKYLRSPIRIEIAPAGTAAETVSHELIVVDRLHKTKLVQELIKECPGTVLVFTRTKHGAARLCRDLRNATIAAAEIHADRSLGQRRQALDGFKKGMFRVLVATDIAARGIDVTGIELVVNYDLPDHAEDYVHRIGRTGRAGIKGRAISFALPDQTHLVRAIERVLRTTIPVRKHAAVAAAALVSRAPMSRGRMGSRPMGRSSGSRPRAPYTAARSTDRPANRPFDRDRRPRNAGPSRGGMRRGAPRPMRDPDESPERYQPVRRGPLKRPETPVRFGGGQFSFKTSL